MGGLSEFLAMGGHAAFIWPAWGIAVVALAWITLASFRTLAKNRREVAALEALRPNRPRRARSSDRAEGSNPPPKAGT